LNKVLYAATVAALEDKVVQRAALAVLNEIYEEDFLGFCVLQRHGKRDMEKELSITEEKKPCCKAT
jgi:RNA-directed DNA polymerase